MERRLSEFDAQVQERLKVAIADATISLRGEIEQMASAAARREALIVANQLRGEMREIAREEVRVLTDDVRRGVREELDRNNTVVAGLITNEVRRATADLPELVRKEVNTRTRPLNPGSVVFPPGEG
jgi:hypothetical protein